LVGGDVSAPDWNQHPMVFPQGTGAFALYDASVAFDAKFVDRAGGNKWGVMYCAEDAACSISYQHASAAAKAAGLDPVYGEQVSLTQPSFTAQCLNAKSKGVNILVVTLDANSVSRVARDCAAQQFHPLYAAGSVIVTSELAKDANLENMISIEPTFGWTYAGSPAAQEFQNAVKTLSPNLNVSSAASASWASGKLLQAALAKVPPSATVTAQDVVNGLYALHDETLGGLAPPLAFAPNAPAPQAKCYFGVQIQKGAWVALNDGQAYC
jgi:branched-chain amino acid transport system substrate-binding protein